MKYRAEIDGLRALAVIPVILFHAGFDVFKGGFIGVDVFFVISGYLITTILISDLEKGNFSLLEFYERRARRILPALFLVMLCCIPFVWLYLSPRETVSFAKSVLATLSFSSNILFWQESGYFDSAAELKPLLHTWSLAVEEQYYVLFPLFLMVFWRFGSRAILILLGFSFLLSLGVAQWASYNKPSASFYLLPTRAWQILLGSFCAFYLFKSNTQNVRKNYFTCLACVGVLLILVSIFTFDKSTPTPSIITLIPTVGTALIILLARFDNFIQKILSSRLLVSIGLISYSAYLWHQPVFAVARHSELFDDNSLYMLGFSVLSLSLAWISWFYVETPFRNKAILSRKRIFQLALIGTLLFAISAILTLLNKGNLNRYPDHVIELNDKRKKWDKLVWEQKNNLQNKSFKAHIRKKILVVGDSNSGDLINALSALANENSIGISSLTIRKGCGNLYLPESEYIDKRERTHESCLTDDDLFSMDSKTLFTDADIIIFASNWQPWEMLFIEASYRQITLQFGDKIWLFGNKSSDFEYEDLYEIYSSDSTPANISALPTSEAVSINAKLQEIAGSKFINPFSIMCSTERCPIIDKDGEFVFYDGFHLTPMGIQRLADGLSDLDILK